VSIVQVYSACQGSNQAPKRNAYAREDPEKDVSGSRGNSDCLERSETSLGLLMWPRGVSRQDTAKTELGLHDDDWADGADWPHLYVKVAGRGVTTRSAGRSTSSGKQRMKVNIE
jgi:hypothetical protein